MYQKRQRNYTEILMQSVLEAYIAIIQPLVGISLIILCIVGLNANI